MRQRLIPIVAAILCALSLLIAVLAVARWMVRNLRGDAWTCPSTSNSAEPGMMNVDSWEVDLSGGYLALSMDHEIDGWQPIANDRRIVHDYRPTNPPSFWAAGTPGVATLRPLPWCEFDATGFGKGQPWQWFLRLPLLEIAIVFAIPPLKWELTHRSRAKRLAQSRHGLCRQCGYDLRESPQRCPECGTPAPRNWSILDRLLHSPFTRIHR